MAANQFLSLPAVVTGLAPVSSATAWAFGTPVAVTTLVDDIKVFSFNFQNTDIPVVDVLQEILFEITIGGTTFLQVPFSMKADTLVGYDFSPPKSGSNNFYFPNPYFIPACSVVAIKVTDSIAAALTYNGVKILYDELSYPTVALNSPSDVSSDSDTTPTLNFTGTDADAAMALEYQVQVDTVNTFDSSTSPDSAVTYKLTGVMARADSGNITPALPTGWAVDDIFILVVISDDNVTPTFPVGWTSLNTTTNGATMVTTVAWRRAVSGDTGPLVTHTAGSFIAAIISNFSGASGAGTSNSPFTQVGTPLANASSATLTANGITAGVNDFVLFVATYTSSTGISTWNVTDPTLTLITDAINTINGGAVVAKLKGGMSSGGTTGVNTATMFAPSINIGQLLAIQVATIPSPLLSASSATDAGFTSGHPFASATPIDYTVQSALTSPDTYYWRVRANRAGSCLFGEWSDIHSFNVT